MAIIVLHKNSGRKYIMIGTGFSVYKDSKPSFLGGTLFPDVEEGEFRVAAVCDAKGIIHWIETAELQVLEVDGKSTTHLLQAYLENDEENLVEDNFEGEFELCPACGAEIPLNVSVCPSCDLTLC